MNKSLFFIFSLLLLLFSTNINAKEEKEKVGIEDLDKFGVYEPIKKYPEGMGELFKHCKNQNLFCASKVAGKFVYNTFRKKGSYNEKYPGEIMKAMAMYEVLFLSKFRDNKKKFDRYRKNWPNDYGYRKKNDENAIRKLKSMNKGREKMRSALGMTLEIPTEEAIKRFWTLGEFLGLGEPKKIGKLDQDVKKRKKLLQRYKATVIRLKEKLKEE